MASFYILGELLPVPGALHGLPHTLKDTAALLHVLGELLVLLRVQKEQLSSQLLLFVQGTSLVVSHVLKGSLELLFAPR